MNQYSGGRFYPDPFPPKSATAWGDDDFGLWFDFKFGEVSQRMRWIEPGTFWMGSLVNESNRNWDEGPRHLVTLTKGYWLADTACTQALWCAVVKENPSHNKADPELPVEFVSWDDVVEKFLPTLQKMFDDLVPMLPTEAQWEYACRAGRGGSYWFGDFITRDQVNFQGTGTVTVKSRPANNWGLYQMHGNVWEWCSGSPRYYSAESSLDPPDGNSDAKRALRGGTWMRTARWARSACRLESSRENRFLVYGFRILLACAEP